MFKKYLRSGIVELMSKTFQSIPCRGLIPIAPVRIIMLIWLTGCKELDALTVFGLYVNATPSPAAVNQPITFNVTVNDGHQFEAIYYFLYGDNSHEKSTANIVKHSYNISGYFPVKIIVSTATGNSSTTIGVFVENEIVDANVFVLHWNSCYLFAVTIQYNKAGEADYYRSTKYAWNFTSCSLEIKLNITTSSPLLKYEFSNAECYHYDLWVYNAVSSVLKQDDLSVKDEKTIHAIISGPKFALVNSTVKFDGNIDLLIPCNITYRWIIINHNNGIVLKNFTSTDATLHVVFNRTAIYEVAIEGLGSHSHIIFNASTTITITAIYNFQLMATPSIVAVNQTVVLSVTKVTNMEDFIYLFLFGDNQPSVQTSNSSVIHSYSVAGSYQTSITIEGIGTSIHFETVIIVQDKIDTICVNTHVKSSTVTYIVIIDCGMSSDHTYGTIQYIWNFNNGKNITTSLTTIITTYQFTGVYNFSLLASNNVSQKSYSGQIYIDTESDTTNVQIIITGPRFTLVNCTVSFCISSEIPIILNNLMFNWTIIDQEINQVYVNKESNKLVIKFFKPGNYKVFASVNHNGSMFSSSHIISVESNLCYIKVDCPPIIEVARQTAIFIHLYDIHNDSYKDFVNISITSDTQSIMLQYVKSPIIVKTYLSYSVNNVYTIYVSANNHVSEASTNFSVEVVRTNTTLLLEFSVVALSQFNVSYETTSWRKQFSDVIDVSLTKETSLLDWQLVVTAGSVRDFLEMFVDILPMSSSLTALADATMIANQLMDVIKSNCKFTLPNSSSCISVSNAIIVGLQQKTEGPTKGIPKKNDDHALRLGTGIGVPVLLVIIISILIGIIYYRRNHQRKQYGHLSLSFNVERDIDLDRNDEITIWTRTP